MVAPAYTARRRELAIEIGLGRPKVATPKTSKKASASKPAKGAPPSTKGKLSLRLGKSPRRSEEHTSELQSLMRTSYAVFCLKKKTDYTLNTISTRADKP